MGNCLPLFFSASNIDLNGEDDDEHMGLFEEKCFKDDRTYECTDRTYGAVHLATLPVPSTDVFGAPQASSPFSSTTTFGASSPAFGASSSPVFGSSASPFRDSSAFGSSTPFGATSTHALGATSTHALGATSTPAFEPSSPSSFSFGSSRTFGQSTSSFGRSSRPSLFGSTSSLFGSTPSLFGSTPSLVRTSTQGAHASTPTFGGQRGGTRVMPFASTIEREANGTQPEKLESISAMPLYKDKAHEEVRWENYQKQPTWKLESIAAMPLYKAKTHEELRWEDYQQGDKGGQLTRSRKSPRGAGFRLAISQSNAFAPVPVSGQTFANPTNAFSSSMYRSSPSMIGSSSSLSDSSPTQRLTPSKFSFNRVFGPT